MTAALARRIAHWSLIAWSASVLLVVVFGSPNGTSDLAASAGALLLAMATALLLSWVTSMAAGPFALVKMRGRPDLLGVWKTPFQCDRRRTAWSTVRRLRISGSRTNPVAMAVDHIGPVHEQ